MRLRVAFFTFFHDGLMHGLEVSEESPLTCCCRRLKVFSMHILLLQQ